ncbi:MAG: NAD-dependent epimerase/dehydratase family protein [Rhodospirillaceae bacterium]|nr:NAD-dependent epimerase/dehydratase family protein [Rhodospirillaceae bacterium]
MKVVITGGTGFIGQMLARRLLAKGTLISASGRPEIIDEIVLSDFYLPEVLPEELDDRVSIVSGDISDPATINALVDRDDIAVFHFASVVSAGGEKDFDMAMRVNLDGARHVLEALRNRGGMPKLLFTSSLATFGGDAMPSRVSDTTKPNPQTTYGMTKFIGELMINDYARKGFVDGRVARLPNIVLRPGKPNAAASSFNSGIFREPLNVETCYLPVSRDTVMADLGHRNTVEGIITLMELDGDKLGSDRAVFLPSRSFSMHECVAAMEKVAAARGIKTGDVVDKPDPLIQTIISGWPTEIDSSRGLALGLPQDQSLEQVIEDYIDDFMD